MSARRLVLFDIDGTLLHSHGAGRRAMETALREAFGTTGSPLYRYDGKTDRQIVRDLMRVKGSMTRRSMPASRVCCTNTWPAFATS
jgi:phosphoglycolate phosphatase-like HAD superfamily hydrolase